ncbi:MAG: hypothetical protein AAFO58_02550, partial [Pseudomonadota bacterium]
KGPPADFDGPRDGSGPVQTSADSKPSKAWSKPKAPRRDGEDGGAPTKGKPKWAPKGDRKPSGKGKPRDGDGARPYKGKPRDGDAGRSFKGKPKRDGDGDRPYKGKPKGQAADGRPASKGDTRDTGKPRRNAAADTSKSFRPGKGSGKGSGKGGGKRPSGPPKGPPKGRGGDARPTRKPSNRG